MAAQLVLAYGLTVARCGEVGASGSRWTAEVVLAVGAVVLAALAECAAVAVFLETRPVEHDGPPPDGRRHFFATGAMIGNLLFLTVILLTGIGSSRRRRATSHETRPLLRGPGACAPVARAWGSAPCGDRARERSTGDAAEGARLPALQRQLRDVPWPERQGRLRAAPGQRWRAVIGPRLKGVGALAADFYLRTGYMPLRTPYVQPRRSRVLFSDRELRALVAYVASLGPGPVIPRSGARLPVRRADALHPQLRGLPSDQRRGRLRDRRRRAAARRGDAGADRPGDPDRAVPMPRFSEQQLDDRAVDSIIRYVQHTKHRTDPGAGRSDTSARSRKGSSRG